MEKLIIYFGQPCKIACDEKCNKAWGIGQRPKEQLSSDEDDVAWLSDSELSEAPVDPGTYEGGFVVVVRNNTVVTVEKKR